MKREEIDALAAAVQECRDRHFGPPDDHYTNGVRDGLAMAYGIVIAAMVDQPATSRPAPLAGGQRRRWIDGRRPSIFTIVDMGDALATLSHEEWGDAPVTIVRSFVESNSELIGGGE